MSGGVILFLSIMLVFNLIESFLENRRIKKELEQNKSDESK